MKTVAFRCNTGVSVGIGHLMRCRAMAAHLSGLGWGSVIMGPPPSLREAEDSALFLDWIAGGEALDRQADARAFAGFCVKHGASHAVIDDYRGVPEYQRILKDAGLRWLQQFDASAPFEFYADVLVNSGAHAKPQLYAPYIRNPDCQGLFGPRYAVVRPEFLRRTALARADVARVLVAFGGGDDRGAIGKTVQALQASAVQCVVISGKANPANDTLRAQLGGVEFHVAPDDIARLMAGCDLAVIAGGTMSYEAAAMGLPFATMALAPNQRGPCEGWRDTIGAPYLGEIAVLSADDIAAQVLPLIADATTRAQLAARGRDAVDGKGVARLVDALIKGEGA